MRKICSLMEIDAKIGVCEVKLIRKVQMSSLLFTEGAWHCQFLKVGERLITRVHLIAE